MALSIDDLLRGTTAGNSDDPPDYVSLASEAYDGDDNDVSLLSIGKKARKAATMAATAAANKGKESSTGRSKRRIRNQSMATSAPESEYAGLDSSTLDVSALLRTSGASGGSSASQKQQPAIAADVQKSLRAACGVEAAAKPRAAPIVEQRVTRRAAYEAAARKLGDDWTASIKANRASDTLDLRESQGAGSRNGRMGSLSAASMVAKFTPTTDMEREITRLLEGSGGYGDEKQLAEAEAKEMEGRGATAEQVREKQREMARMRSLLFYEEIKRKRHRQVCKNGSGRYSLGHRISGSLRNLDGK